MAFISKWTTTSAIGIMISILKRIKSQGQMHNDYKIHENKKKLGNFNWIWGHKHRHLLLLRMHTDYRLLLVYSK